MSKYGAIKTDGRASKKEARRAQELMLLQRCGQIFDLKEQVRVELIPKQDGERSVHYVIDFVYHESGKEVWEDTKGFRTPLYILKRKLVLQRYGIKIRET
jgi:hypothetical protein